MTGFIVVVSLASVLVGATRIGERVLFGLAPEHFRRAVATLIGVLGLWLLFS